MSAMRTLSQRSRNVWRTSSVRQTSTLPRRNRSKTWATNLTTMRTIRKKSLRRQGCRSSSTRTRLIWESKKSIASRKSSRREIRRICISILELPPLRLKLRISMRSSSWRVERTTGWGSRSLTSRRLCKICTARAREMGHYRLNLTHWRLTTRNWLSFWKELASMQTWTRTTLLK